LFRLCGGKCHLMVQCSDAFKDKFDTFFFDFQVGVHLTLKVLKVMLKNDA
jgi:hypothetical protein